MDHGYERGWRRYSFDEVSMRLVKAHASDVAIGAAAAFNRGPGELQMSLLELPPHAEGDAIGLHIHRDFPTGRDVEEIYIVVSGDCVMSFSNGDEVTLAPGDVVTSYPGTGHAVRVVGETPVRIVVVVPHAFRSDKALPAVDAFPEHFSPRIEVLTCHPSQMTPLEAQCRECGQTWAAGLRSEQPPGLREWASDHRCVASSAAFPVI
jgi:mannose-6-phosphate isomerase-like protein (cupin superfamily)